MAPIRNDLHIHPVQIIGSLQHAGYAESVLPLHRTHCGIQMAHKLNCGKRQRTPLRLLRLTLKIDLRLLKCPDPRHFRRTGIQAAQYPVSCSPHPSLFVQTADKTKGILGSSFHGSGVMVSTVPFRLERSAAKTSR